VQYRLPRVEQSRAAAAVAAAVIVAAVVTETPRSCPQKMPGGSDFTPSVR
jgi:hypothetical protein